MRTTFKRILAAALGLAAMASAQSLPVGYPPVPGNATLEQALLHYTNLARGAQGMPALKADEGLALAARHHAAEMAKLHYLSHVSPTPRTATLALRVAKAGLAVQTLGENIASIPFGPELAKEAVDGWLASPGHRANLLSPEFTHVGFGIATDENGLSYLVQDFAFRPLKLQSAKLHPHMTTSFRLDITVRSSQRQQAVLFYGDENSRPFQLRAGSQTIQLSLSGSDRIHLGIGVKSSGATYILQDEGWLNLKRGSFEPSAAASRHTLAIERVGVRAQQRALYAVELKFDGRPATALAVWLNDEPLRSAVLSGQSLTFDLPQGQDQQVIDLGLRMQGNRYRVIMSLSLQTSGPRARLVPFAH